MRETEVELAIQSGTLLGGGKKMEVSAPLVSCLHLITRLSEERNVKGLIRLKMNFGNKHNSLDYFVL